MTMSEHESPHPSPQDSQPLGWSTVAVMSHADSAASDESLFPRAFGGYTLLRCIGAGGFGQVFLAHHDGTWERWAIKVLAAHRLQNESSRQRFYLEARIGSELKHPNILPVVDQGLVDGQPFIVMPFVDGTNLQQFIGKHPLEVPRAVELARLIADAVHVAHETGYLHRDIKPENILVERETGKPFIADFGLAKATIAPLGISGTEDVIGTQPYMPPEQIDPVLGDITAATDVYALGVTLYQALTGRTPFPRQDRPGRDIKTQIAWDAPVPPSALNPLVPADLDRVCLVCLQKSPHDRYGSAAEFAADLKRVENGQPVEACLPSGMKLLWRRAQRRPLQAAAMLVLLVLATAGIWSAGLYANRATRAETNLVNAEGRADHAEVTADLAVRRKAMREYVADMREVSQARDAHDIARMETLLDRHRPADGIEDLRGLEWYYWDQVLKGLCRRIEAEPGIRCLVVSDDNRLLATANLDHASLWSLATGERLFQLQIGPRKQRQSANAPVEACDAVALSRDGTLLAATTFIMRGPNRVGTLRVWETATGNERFAVTDDDSISGQSVAFSLDSSQVVAGGHDGRWQSWDLATGTPAATGGGSDPRDPYPSPRSHPVTRLHFSEDGLFIETTDETIRRSEWLSSERIDARDSSPPQRGRGGGRQGSVLGAVLAHDSIRLLSSPPRAGFDDTPRQTPFEERYKATSIYMRGQRLIAGCSDNVVRVWTVPPRPDRTPTDPHELLGASGPLDSVGFHNRLTLAATSGGIICIWDGSLATDPLAVESELTHYQHSWEGEREYGMTRSPSGRLHTRFNPDAGTVSLLNTDGVVLAERMGRSASPGVVLYSPTERFVAFRGDGASDSSVPAHFSDNTVILWEVQRARRIATIPYPEGTHIVPWCFSPDEKLFAAASIRSNAIVVETGSGREVSQLAVPGILELRFSPNSGRLAVGARKQVAVWDVASANWVFRADRGARDMQFDASGNWLTMLSFEDRQLSLTADLATGEIGPTDSVNMPKQTASSADGRRHYAITDGVLNVYFAESEDDEPILSVPVAGLSGDPTELAAFLAARMAAWTADSAPN
jgi:Serine/threonine protein kinase